MDNELFSKYVFLDENRQIGVIEVPHGVALEGITYSPENGETLTQRISFSTDATIKLSEILQEWLNTPLMKNKMPF